MNILKQLKVDFNFHVRFKWMIFQDKNGNEPFSDEERANFINRQIVETRQSTKAVARILQEICPNSEIVYVKAHLSSDFRHTFGFEKCRDLNDLHHAKDAYSQ